MLISKKPGRTQFVQLGMPTTYDFERPQDFFTKHLKKQFYYQHNPWNILQLWHHLHPEPSWTFLHSIPSHANCEGSPLMGVINHPNWLTFAREPLVTNDLLQVVIFINIRLFSFCFSLCKDIINHKDILLSFVFNNGEVYWLMNIYSYLSHSAIKYLKDTEFNFWNLLIMTEDFNIHDSLWDPSYIHYSSISDDIFVIADSFNLSLSYSTDQVLTRYLDNANDLNSVIDLIFLCSNSSELDTYCIHPE